MDAMQAVIYTRVSNDRSGQGRSVEDQEGECRAECERKGWPVREVFCDNDIGASRHSGKRRPAWEELKANIRAGDIVVMWEASRGGRDLGEHVLFRDRCAELGVPVSYGGKQLDMAEGEDRFQGALDAILAEREAEVLRGRVLRGKRSSASKGKPYGRAPWGLRRADTAELKWEPDPDEAPRLREAMDRVLDGKSLRSVLLWLRATGRAPTDVTGLRRGLCNPAVAGLRVHQARAGKVETFKADWDPIVTPDEQARVRAQAKRNPEPRGREPVHLLSGIAKCGVCDAGLQHKRREGRRDSYRCPHGHIMRDVVLVDGVALAELVKDFAKDDLPAEDAKALAAKAKITRIEQQIEEAEEQVVNDEMTAAAFARIEQRLLAKIAELQPLTVQAIPDPYEYVKISAEEFLAASVPERRAMMRARVSVVVNPVPAGRRALPEDTVVTPRR
ncbi:recombinase family protein [Mycolicibacterium hodleri]|uniref:Recombinase family protein n=1 Tax=Mycolicibacterium hodleri TaxID=49897 RepID=A0A502E2I3_9MYCO|nr:recombinase family protein [Mycolicibacterium hodleri]TPG31747.1 recombinase family protein [Mycolicibacterium hodleri]